jgi:hypothetical protein
MPFTLGVVAVVLCDLLLTCVLLRWIPAKRDRWIAALPFPLIAALTLTLRHTAGASWPAALAGCAGFVWGILLALLPFRGWVSSWTLPVRGEARLRWREAALVVPGVLTPLSTKRMDAAVTKAFAVRQVVRARGPFPLPLGVTLLTVPVACALAARWASQALGG